MRPDAFVRTGADVLDDLHDRLVRWRRVPALDPALGLDPGLLDDLVAHWRDGFDWRAQEDRLAAYPWVETEESVVPVRAIVSRSDPQAPTVLLLHGWPDSVLRFERVLPQLSDVNHVVPALPGFPFSAPARAGLSTTEVADAVAAAMREFGFARYVVSAGDVGCDVAEALAARHPDAVSSLHLTDVSQLHYLLDPPTDLDDEERAYLARGHRWQAEEGGYMHEQSTRPNTLAVGLGDSPAGLAAWIVEKLLRWSDGDGSLVDVYSLDEALTWVMAYWVAGSIGTSFAPYAVGGRKDWPRVEVPTVFTVFPRDLVNAPRRFAERFFRVAEWREFERGGHFAAWERPQDYLWGVRRALEVSQASRTGSVTSRS
jgi:pimeloyl-ACP methyl ester carboxylesterase